MEKTKRRAHTTCPDYSMFACMDCGDCTNCSYEYYMVTDEVWYSVTNVMNTDGMLCIGCLESRRGKLLTKEDFSAAPLNSIAMITGSDRLRSRLK